MSALKALITQNISGQTNYLITEITEILLKAGRRRERIQLSRLPAHKGMKGNNKAGILAKAAVKVDDVVDRNPNKDCGHSGSQFFGISDFMKRKFRFLETSSFGISKVYKKYKKICPS
jgi:hypothetical protein